MAYREFTKVLKLTPRHIRPYIGNAHVNFYKSPARIMFLSHATPFFSRSLYHFSTVSRDAQPDTLGDTRDSSKESTSDSEDGSKAELFGEDWFDDLDDKTPLRVRKFSADDPKAESNDYLYFNRKKRIKECLTKLKKGPDGKYTNVFEVATEVDMLIAAFLKLKAKESSIYLDDDSDEEYSLEDIDVERFKRLQKQLRSGTFEFKPVVRAPPPKSKTKK